MAGVSFCDLRREEILWETLLRVPPTLLPADISSWTTDKLLRLLTKYQGNINSLLNIYFIYQHFDYNGFLSQLCDLQSKIHDIISSSTSLSAHQVSRLRSRLLHYKSKFDTILILYPGGMTEPFLMAETILDDIWQKWLHIDKSPYLADYSQPPAVESDRDVLDNVRDPFNYALQSRDDLNFPNVTNSATVPQHSFQNVNLDNSVSPLLYNNSASIPVMQFRHLDSPLLQNFSDRIIYSGRTFRNILDFLKKLIIVKRQMMIWNLPLRHVFQVLARYTNDKLSERVEYALLHNYNLDDFHRDILNFFIPSYVQQQLSVYLVSRGQRPDENLSDFVRDIKNYHDVFFIPLSESHFVSNIVTKFNLISRLALPLSSAPTTYHELDLLVSKVKSVNLLDKITVQQCNSNVGLDHILNLNCEDSRDISVPNVDAVRNFRPGETSHNNLSDSSLNMSRRFPEYSQQHASFSRPRYYANTYNNGRTPPHRQNSSQVNRCFRCGSSSHFIRACPMQSRRYARTSNASRP